MIFDLYIKIAEGVMRCDRGLSSQVPLNPAVLKPVTRKNHWSMHEIMRMAGNDVIVIIVYKDIQSSIQV